MNPYISLTVFILLSLVANRVDAHFLFAYGEDGKVKVVFGESTDPDQAQFLGRLKSMQAFTFAGDEKQQVEFEKVVEGDDGWFETPLGQVGSVVNIACPYGVFGRGDKSMYLDYSAKYVRFPIDSAAAMKPSRDLMLDMVPSFKDGQLQVAVNFKGMPLNEAQVSLTLMEYDTVDTQTDDTGRATLDTNTRYIVRAKHIIEENGELDGKSFSEKRYYCTMVLDLGGSAAAAATNATTEATPTVQSNSRFSLEQIDRGYEALPHGLTSFGATVLDGKIYTAGGKSGRAHHYARSFQNDEIWCLGLEGQKWETVAETLGLQGLAIVAHEDKIIRIGGLEARNEEGEEHLLRSLDAVKSFDPKTKKWSSLPSLPQGRSSFDACVHNHKIYVAGGWTMAIGEESEWATDMLVLDLSAEKPLWQSIETPFEVRAVSVRAFDNKLFVLGGIEENGPTDVVQIFDFENEEWSNGPDIPCEGGMRAFGCSAASTDGHFLVSTYDGGVYRLNDDQSNWEKVHQLKQGRFFHQMLPVGDSSFAIIGGAHMKSGGQTEILVFELKQAEKQTLTQN